MVEENYLEIYYTKCRVIFKYLLFDIIAHLFA